MWLQVRIGLVSACLAALMALPVSAPTANRHDYFPYGWGWGWNGCWDSSWNGPYEFPPYWEGPYETYEPTTGKIKLEHVDKEDNVFLDGSYIGSVSTCRRSNSIIWARTVIPARAAGCIGPISDRASALRTANRIRP